MQKQVYCIAGIHPFNVCIRVFSSVVAKLSIACCNQNISTPTWREKLLQLQVDVVSVVEVKQPGSVDLACKPLQNPIHGSLSISWRNGLEIRSKSLFTRGVNVEDLRKSEE